MKRHFLITALLAGSLILPPLTHAAAPVAGVNLTGTSSGHAIISNVSIESNASTSTEASSGIVTVDSASILEPFSISRGKAEADASSTLPSIYDVRSSHTLQLYAAGLMQQDERFEKVSVNKSGTITMRYATHGKLLGFIPVRMPVFVDIAADGSIGVRYPWYTFLTKPTYDRESIQVALAAEAARTISRGDNSNGKPAPVLDDRITNVDPVTQVVGAATGTPQPGSILTPRLRASIMERMRAYLSAQETGTLELEPAPQA